VRDARSSLHSWRRAEHAKFAKCTRRFIHILNQVTPVLVKMLGGNTATIAMHLFLGIRGAMLCSPVARTAFSTWRLCSSEFGMQEICYSNEGTIALGSTDNAVLSTAHCVLAFAP